MKRKSTLTLLGILLLSSGCGPTVPLEVAMRQALITVFAGHHPPSPSPSLPPAYAPPPPLNLGFQAYTPPPPAVFSCPDLSEFVVVKDPATALISGPPVLAQYLMRSSGKYSLGSVSGKLPTTIAIAQPAPPKPGNDQVDGAFQDYSLITGPSASAYTYYGFRLAPNNAATPGILLTSLHWKDPVRGSFDFFPDQPLQFLPTPVSPNTSNPWAASGTDPFDQTSVTLQGTVPKRVTINACGVPLDSFDVQISGNIVSPTFQLTWKADYYIGTQFGGLILGEHVTFSGPDRTRNLGDSYAYDETSTINVQPEFPH